MQGWCECWEVDSLVEYSGFHREALATVWVTKRLRAQQLGVEAMGQELGTQSQLHHVRTVCPWATESSPIQWERQSDPPHSGVMRIH